MRPIQVQVKMIAVFALISATFLSMPVAAGPWGKSETILRGRDKVVTYRAKVENGWLIVEAKHEKGWHTYSMDNVLRAREKTGKERPDTELPTRIELESGLEASGKWHQSNPKDLSTPAIKWYTWGFDGVSRFAVPVESTGEPIQLVVNAQACNASSCSMVDDLALTVPAPSVADAEDAVSKAPEGLIPVREEEVPKADNSGE